MSNICLTTTLLATVLALATAQTTTPPATTTPPPPPAPPATTPLGFCAQGKGDLCHGPAGSGPSPRDGTATAEGRYTMDPSQWLCAGNDNGAQKFMPAASTWNTATGSYCDDSNTVGANTACPALCGASNEIFVPTAAGDGYGLVTPGTPNTNDDCNGKNDNDDTSCYPQTKACESFKVTNAGGANAGLTFANEIPFLGQEGALHARCPGSVLKAVCQKCPPLSEGGCTCDTLSATLDANATSNGDASNVSFENCAEWYNQCTQIPQEAQWVEDYATGVYLDGYDFDNATYSDSTDWTRNVPGYFNGIIPNYKSSMQLTTGQLVVIRIWAPGAQAQMPKNTYMPTGNADGFAATQAQYEAICDNKKWGVMTSNTGNAARKWCWKRGKIAIRMGEDKYVVQIDAPGAPVVKGITAFDVRPLCFADNACTAKEPCNQPAECSTSGGACLNMAGQVSGFKYALGQQFAVDNQDGTYGLYTVNSIDQDEQQLKSKSDAKTGKVTTAKVIDPKLMKCFNPIAPFSTGVNCTNHYVQGTTPEYHYGMEIMKLDGKGNYQRGIIQTFSPDGNTATVQLLNVKPSAAAAICYDLQHPKADEQSWDLRDESVMPLCYQQA